MANWLTKEGHRWFRLQSNPAHFKAPILEKSRACVSCSRAPMDGRVCLLIRGDRGHFRLACQERPAG
jgi:hypothetical protein